MPEDERATFIEDSDSKVQIDKEGNLFIKGDKEIVLSSHDLNNFKVIRKALERDDNLKSREVKRKE